MFGIAYNCRISLYSRFHLHVFNIDECDGEDMEYDVFLCSAGMGSAIALVTRDYFIYSDSL